MKGDVIVCDDGRVIRDLGDVISIFIPMEIKRRSGRKTIVLPDQPEEDSEPTPLQVALARAYVWRKWIDEGKYENASCIAEKLGLDLSVVSRHLKLANLAPRIIERFLAGREDNEMSLAKLRGQIPLLWTEQEKMIPRWLAPG